MSLAVLADHMASRGRGPDSMLIHMSPREVQGLQALAMAHGGSLTINPDTGLPEAGFLDKLLPTILGAGSGFAVPVQTLINADGSSWLGDNYSPALLYGALVEAYIFMKGEQDMMTYYETKFKEALAQLNRLGTGLERGDAYRDGQAKIKVNP